MPEVKRPRGRPRNPDAAATLASNEQKITSLQNEIADLRMARETDTKKLDDLLYQLGEVSARILTGKYDPDNEAAE